MNREILELYLGFGSDEDRKLEEFKSTFDDSDFFDPLNIGEILSE